MRKNRFDRLLAGTVLALIVAAPTFAIAAPDRVESVGAAAAVAQRTGAAPPRRRAGAAAGSAARGSGAAEFR